jgi:hypothetical protein
MATSQPKPPERFEKPESEKTRFNRHIEWMNDGIERLMQPIIALVGWLGIFFANRIRDDRVRFDFASDTLVLPPRPERPPRTDYELGRSSAMFGQYLMGLMFIPFLLSLGAAGTVASAGTPAAVGLGNGLLIAGFLLVRGAMSFDDIDAVEVESQHAVDEWGR